MKPSILSYVYKVGLKYPLLTLILGVCLAGASLHFAKNLSLQTDFSALLPRQTESVQNLDRLKETFGNLEFLYATVEADDVESAKAFADVFALRLEELPEIRYVDYQRPVEFFQKRKWLFLEVPDLEEMHRRVDRSLELQEEGVSPVFSNLMDFADPEDRPDLSFEDIQKKYESKFNIEAEGRTTSQEGRFIVIRVKVKKGPEDFEANRSLVAKIRNLEQDIRSNGPFDGVKLGLAGSYLTSIESVDMLNKEIFWVTAGVIGCLLLILLLYFRQVSGAILVGVPLAIGVLWTGGLIYFILGQVNIVTAFAVSILAGLGSDYGIYLLSRFKLERQSGADFETACAQAFGRTGQATFTAMITTVGAFGALIFSGFKVFVEFGIVGASGLLLNFLAMMLLIPSLLALGERYRNRSFARILLRLSPDRRGRRFFTPALVKKLFLPRAPITVVLLTMVLIGGSALTLPKIAKIHFEDGNMNFENIPSNRLYHRISDSYGSSLHPTILLVKGKDNEQKLLRSLEARLDAPQENPLVYEKALGISTFIPDAQDGKKASLQSLAKKYRDHRYINPDQKRKFTLSIQETLDASSIDYANLPVELTRFFTSPNEEDLYAIYVFPAMERLGAEGMATYNQGILNEEKIAGVDAIPVDGSFVSLDVVNLVSQEAPRGFLLILAFFSGVLFLTLRDIKRTLLILVHLFGSLILISGAYYFMGIKLNILNIAVFPIILGTGIDSFIHFNARYNESGDLSDAISNEVPAILISNLTSIVGFGGLLFTSGSGIRSIGWVSDVGLIVVTLVCVLVFPRVLFFLAQQKYRRLGLKESIAEG